MLKDQDKIIKLSQDILQLSRNTLLVHLRFLDVALSRLAWLPTPDIDTVMVDGVAIYYQPVYLLKLYKQEKNLPTRYYLHMIFHCVFQHYFVDTLLDQDCWNLACDIAVEAVMDELNLPCLMTDGQEERNAEIEKFREQVKYMTAESLCRYFLDAHLEETEMKRLQRLFAADDHQKWYDLPEREEPLIRSQEESPKQTEGLEHPKKKQEDTVCLSSDFDPDEIKIKEMWKNIALQMQTEIEMFLKDRGYEGGCLVQNLQAINRETYDYTSFLKKFATPGETMKINEDEFDYIFYTYGLKMYGNMPLIEPLEYKEVKKIREFVIAIDTSGSTSGELVQKFVQKTYNILKQQESFYSRINLHIIQCDAKIQEDVKITNQEEFDRYLEHMEIKGQGGTDFQVLFSYIDELVEKHELTALKGVLFFTDGYGEFPKRQPDYKVAVIYVEEGYRNPEVPVWAIKLVLRPDEIEEF